jgi:predicted ArsR family transcriptional regulator
VSSDDGVLRLANCPYDRLAQEHREVVCAVNHAFISGMIEGLGTPGARAELEPRPGMCCVALHVT